MNRFELYQRIIEGWVIDLFGVNALRSVNERCLRLGEEVIELIQSTGEVTREQMHGLVDYVYNREPGESWQEMGGTMLTLAALASALKLSPLDEMKRELKRVCSREVIRKVRLKQIEKSVNGVGGSRLKRLGRDGTPENWFEEGLFRPYDEVLKWPSWKRLAMMALHTKPGSRRRKALAEGRENCGLFREGHP